MGFSPKILTSGVRVFGVLSSYVDFPFRLKYTASNHTMKRRRSRVDVCRTRHVQAGLPWNIMDEARALKPNTISRASIINFLESMREAGVLKGEEKTGKGGHHWIYSPSMNEAEFKQFIAETILKNLMRNFPEETRGGPRKLRALESPPNTNPKGTQICPHTPQCTNQVDLNPFRFKSGPAHHCAVIGDGGSSILLYCCLVTHFLLYLVARYMQKKFQSFFRGLPPRCFLGGF